MITLNISPFFLIGLEEMTRYHQTMNAVDEFRAVINHRWSCKVNIVTSDQNLLFLGTP